MRRPSNQIQPDQAIALCTRQQAEKLVNYDHHVVQINGRAGVLLTQEWMPLDEHAGPFLLTVIFYSVEKHPPAPAEIQAVLDGLRSQVRGQPR